MKAVILAGGLGTRLSEETHLRPKPMVEIGGRPILWHIMKIYSHHGINEFIICCGYKGYVIKEYFNNYALHQSDITIDFENGKTTVHKQRTEPWKITFVDTGLSTQTGGRLKRVKHFLETDEPFCFTYGDGLTDADISDVISFHKKHKKEATLLATVPPARFGALELSGNKITKFQEKPIGEGGFINGGFFVLNPSSIDLVQNDDCIWEESPLKNLALNDNLMAYKHDGFWRPMDTLRDKHNLEKLWKEGNAPWKKWC